MMSQLHAREPKRIHLARLPTPLVELNQLARELGVEGILMKRDDLTGLEVSGNKVRKLEYVADFPIGDPRDLDKTEDE